MVLRQGEVIAAGDADTVARDQEVVNAYLGVSDDDDDRDEGQEA
jgi:ABC-type uncharacterized transport system ATPase subunit